jgi:hypothetical protein
METYIKSIEESIEYIDDILEQIKNLNNEIFYELDANIINYKNGLIDILQEAINVEKVRLNCLHEILDIIES